MRFKVGDIAYFHLQAMRTQGRPCKHRSLDFVVSGLQASLRGCKHRSLDFLVSGFGVWDLGVGVWGLKEVGRDRGVGAAGNNRVAISEDAEVAHAACILLRPE